MSFWIFIWLAVIFRRDSWSHGRLRAVRILFRLFYLGRDCFPSLRLPRGIRRLRAQRSQVRKKFRAGWSRVSSTTVEPYFSDARLTVRGFRKVFKFFFSGPTHVRFPLSRRVREAHFLKTQKGLSGTVSRCFLTLVPPLEGLGQSLASLMGAVPWYLLLS